MNTFLKVCLVLFCFVFFFAWAWINLFNKEKMLRNQVAAQQKTNEASFDKMWKIIQSQTKVSEKERESFRATYVDIMQATKGVVGQASLAAFFTQSKIDVNNELFSKLMTTIESQRESFYRDQKLLLDIQLQHNNLISTFPGNLFGFEPLNVKIVTSSKASDAFETGEENEI